MSITREEIARLCAEHERLMAEAREPIRRWPASKTDNGGLLYKDYDGNAPAPAPQPDAAANFSHDDETLYALNEFSKAVVERFREIDRENIALKAKLDVVLALLGEKQFSREGKLSDAVVDLPHGFWKRDAA
jgi:hypothetical protein